MNTKVSHRRTKWILAKHALLTLVIFPTVFAQASKVKVAIVDTGLNIYDSRFQDILCPTGHKDFTGEGLVDVNGHGTHVLGILAKAAPSHNKYCVIILKYYAEAGAAKQNLEREDQAFIYAAAQGVSIVNFSSAGPFYDEYERYLLSTLNLKVVVAAGNTNEFYKNYYPAAYSLPNVYVVGNWDCTKGKKAPTSNYGEGLNWRCGTNIKSTLPNGKEGLMSGTSMAVPLYTAELIEEAVK